MVPVTASESRFDRIEVSPIAGSLGSALTAFWLLEVLGSGE